MNTLTTIIPIVCAIFAGLVSARFIPTKYHKYQRQCIAAIGPLVWLLLFLIGADFGEILASTTTLRPAIHSALIFMVFSVLTPAILIALIFDRNHQRDSTIVPARKATIWPAIRSCLTALMMVALGALTYTLSTTLFNVHPPLPSINIVLIIMVFLVGVDLHNLNIRLAHFTARNFILPILTITFGLIGSLIAAKITNINSLMGMALVSGFGWFTLSSVMIGEAYGAHLGTVALLIDLNRELLGIVLLYLVGTRYTYSTMSISGAGAMDTVLPIVKTTCGAEKIPQALISGITLSLAAPLLIGLFLTLSS